MEKFLRIMVDIWREACRQIDIEQAVFNISQLLSQHLPLDQFFIRKIDPAKNRLETVAQAGAEKASTLQSAVTNYSAKDFQQLIDWCRKEQIVIYSETRPDKTAPDVLFRDIPAGRFLIGPLSSDGRCIGLLYLVAGEGETLTDKHIEMFRILLEPLFVALENDIRLRELNILREAAEAEKRSLLTRLRRGGLEELVVGAESGLKLVMERVRTVAKSDVPVMILGETGTGKEVISREIHRLSARAKGPFIRVNCGAIPSELIDSQLFGHERGAFTGAVSSHMGWFERADGGTLFLDEIGELSSAGQVRLLRIIQDGWLERIGSTAPTHVDVRIVVATHQDLAGMISRGGFREDLWYRLAVFPIYLPPLRERKKDIPALALHFAEKAALRFGLALQKPTEEDIRLLSEYDWPGNVRELGSVIDRAALLGDGDGLQVPAALGWLNFMQSGPDPDISVLTPGTDKLLPLDVMVKKHIKTVLQNTRGRIEGEQGAASILQLNPNTLRSKIRKLGIKSGEFRD